MDLALAWGESLPALFESVIYTVNDAILVTKAEPVDATFDGPRVVYVNPAFTTMTGFTSRDIVGRTPRILQCEDTDRSRLDEIRAALEAWQPVEVEVLNRRKDGTPFWVELSIAPVKDGDGAYTHWVSVQREVTRRKRRESGVLSELRDGRRELRSAEALFQSAFDDAPIGMAITTPVGEILRCNPALASLLGRDRQQLSSSTLFDFTHPEDLEEAHSVCDNLRENAGTSEHRVRLLRADGSALHAVVSGSLAVQADGTPSHVVMHVEDVSQREELQSQLAHQALHDPLTGLPNRTLLSDRLQQALARSSRNDAQVGVLFLDLDNFKLVNDGLGHAAGDHVLSTIGQRLSQLVRPGDTAARFGGDEFVLLCCEVTTEEAESIAERVLSAVMLPVTLPDGEEVTTSASIGVVVTDADDPPGRLLADADTAMYQAKRTGRAHYELFDQSLRSRAVDRMTLETALRAAIQEQQLRVLYQPEVRMHDRLVTGVEALVRWEHPQQGLLAPAAFLDLAEETGLIHPLGEWVLREACRQAAAWLPVAPHPVVTWVNLSAHQIADPDLPRAVATALDESGLPPEQLGFEITESVLMNDLGHASATLGWLHALGVRLAIDDFGTGYSSLAYLQNFPIDTLKIDRSFVAGLRARRPRPESHAIVAAVIGLAHTLGLQVVGEGVETKTQERKLSELGCDTAQGFYFARPAPADSTAFLV